MELRIRTPKGSWKLLAGGAALLLIPAAYAIAGSSHEHVIHACYHASNGELRIVDDEGDRKIDWKFKGVAPPQHTNFDTLTMDSF